MDSTLHNLFGATYERGAKSPETQDCKSLFLEIMNHYGNHITIRDIEILAVEQVAAAQAKGEYPYTQVDSQIVQEHIESGKWQKLNKPEIGCAVCIALDANHPDMVQHVGVYVGDNKFIHIMQKTGVITTPINHLFFRRKIRGFYKWIG